MWNEKCVSINTVWQTWADLWIALNHLWSSFDTWLRQTDKSMFSPMWTHSYNKPWISAKLCSFCSRAGKCSLLLLSQFILKGLFTLRATILWVQQVDSWSWAGANKTKSKGTAAVKCVQKSPLFVQLWTLCQDTASKQVQQLQRHCREEVKASLSITVVLLELRDASYNICRKQVERVCAF